MLIAIDPGACTGWALFNAAGRLIGVAVHDHGETPAFAQCADRVVVERPAIYPGGRQKARPRDIITLAIRAGESGVAACVSADLEDAVEYVEPAAWKGRVKKDACHAAIRRALAPEEIDVLDRALAPLPKTKAHNALDAVGIGLHALGRGFR